MARKLAIKDPSSEEVVKFLENQNFIDYKDLALVKKLSMKILRD